MAVGGAELENETSTNISLGMTARFMRDLNLTADFYLVNLNNRISSTSIQGPNLGDIQQFLSFFTNAMDTQHMGFDVVLSHRIMDNTTLTLAYNYNTVSVEERQEVNGNEVISDAWVNAIEKARPEHRFALTGHSTMMGDKLGLMGRVRYYGAHYDTDEPGTYIDGTEYPEETADDERPLHAEIDGIFYLDLELAYKVSKDFQLVAGGMNILNTFPTEILASNGVRNYETHGMKYPVHSVADYQGGSWYLKGVYTF